MQMTRSTETIRYHGLPLPGIDAMSAATTRQYPRHAHDQYGIGSIDYGGHSSWSGRGQVEIGAGGMICCNPGEVTDGRGVGGRSRSWRMLYVEPELFQSLCDDTNGHVSQEFTFARPVFDDGAARELFDEVFRCASSDEHEDAAITCESALIKLIAQLQPHSTHARAPVSEALHSIQRAKERIDDDPAAQVTLAQLALDVGLSRLQLLRAFARDVGLTPHAYIIQKRIQLARRLIADRTTLAEAALLAGFYDQGHMTRWFVRYLGVTPSRYACRS